MKFRSEGDFPKGTTSVVEDYLQVLHYLTRDGYPVIAARLAERLNVSPPTVTVTLQRMERDGLIEHGPHKEILFTRQGREVAENIVRRHALAERLLTDLLKMPWHESHEEAHGVEHVMTPNIEARLLRRSATRRPARTATRFLAWATLNPDEFPLDEAQTGDDLVIQRITEEAEEDLQLMKYLQEHGVEPGARMSVREANALQRAGSSSMVRTARFSLGFPVAAKLRARRV